MAVGKVALVRPKPNWRPIPCPIAGCQAWKWGDVAVFAGVEAGRWHLSISTPYRYPTWDEIKEARYEFVPDRITMAMILPPKSEYVNVHDYCFHLHEIDGDA